MPKSSYTADELTKLLSSNAMTFSAPKNEQGLPVFVFADIEFSDEITLYQINESNSRIEFKNCKFSGVVNFKISECNVQLFFSNCIFEKNVNFEKGNYPLYLGFSESVFFAKLQFSGGTFSQVVLISLNIVNLTLQGGEFKTIQVSKLHPGTFFIKQLNVNSGVLGQVSFHGVTILCITIDGIIESNADLLFSDIRTFFFSIYSVDVKGRLRLNKIRQISFQELSYLLERDSEQYSYFNLFRAHSTFQICSSYLSNTEFQNIAFDRFVSFSVVESYLEDCVFSNITWPKIFKSTIKIFYDGTVTELTTHTRNSFELERDAYRQIKSALKNQHDIIGTQYFYGKEMMSYYNSIHFKDQPGTKLIIWLSFITSNFGQSLRRPLFTILLANGFLFYLLTNFNFIARPDSFGELLGSFLFYNNPLHNIPDSWSSWNYVIDISMRIISSYAIYNFIRASRRFLM